MNWLLPLNGLTGKEAVRISRKGIVSKLIHSNGIRVYRNMIPNIGPMEIILVLGIALMVFGPKKLPELGRSIGGGLKEFKGSLGGDDHSKEEREPQALEQPTTKA